MAIFSPLLPLFPDVLGSKGLQGRCWRRTSIAAKWSWFLAWRNRKERRLPTEMGWKSSGSPSTRSGCMSGAAGEFRGPGRWKTRFLFMARSTRKGPTCCSATRISFGAGGFSGKRSPGWRQGMPIWRQPTLPSSGRTGTPPCTIMEWEAFPLFSGRIGVLGDVLREASPHQQGSAE